MHYYNDVIDFIIRKPQRGQLQTLNSLTNISRCTVSVRIIWLQICIFHSTHGEIMGLQLFCMHISFTGNDLELRNIRHLRV